MAYRLRVIPKRKHRTRHRATEFTSSNELSAVAASLTPSTARRGPFSDLPRETAAALMAISWRMSYPKESTVFVEGEEPVGIFVLSEGRVKLSMNSADGKSIMIRIAEPGELLGLPATISGRRYELTAQTLGPVRADFVPRVPFLQFLRDHGAAAVRVAHSLSDLYRSTLLELRYLGFSGSAIEKLARFLMDLPAGPSSDNGHLWVRLPLTHKEIGEMIGASRETVTRVLGHFKRIRLIEVHNSTLLITNKDALRAIFDASVSLGE